MRFKIELKDCDVGNKVNPNSYFERVPNARSKDKGWYENLPTFEAEACNAKLNMI